MRVVVVQEIAEAEGGAVKVLLTASEQRGVLAVERGNARSATEAPAQRIGQHAIKSRRHGRERTVELGR